MAPVADNFLANSPAYTNPAGPLNQALDQGTQNAIALGGQYLQAKQLEATVNYHKAQIDNEWQQRQDNAYKTLYSLSENNATKSQLTPVVNALSYIDKQRGAGEWNDDKKQDYLDTYSGNPEWGAKNANFQALASQAISSGHPLSADAVALQKSLRDMPGIQNSSNMDKLDKFVENMNSSFAQERRSNVSSIANSAEKRLSNIDSLSDQAIKNKSDPSDILGPGLTAKLAAIKTKQAGGEFTPSDDDANSLAMIEGKLQTGVTVAGQKQQNVQIANKLGEDTKSFVDKIGTSDLSGKYTKQVNALNSKAQDAINNGDVSGLRNINSSLASIYGSVAPTENKLKQANFNTTHNEKLDDQYIKQVTPIEKDYNKLNSSLSEVEKLVNDPKATVRSLKALSIVQSGAIENIKTFGQAAQFKTGLTNMVNGASGLLERGEKMVGLPSEPIPAQTRSDIKDLVQRTKSKLTDEYAGNYNDLLKTYANSNTYSKSAAPGGAIYNDVQQKLQKVASPGAVTQPKLFKMSSGKSYTPDQLRSALPKITDPVMRQHVQQWLDQNGGK